MTCTDSRSGRAVAVTLKKLIVNQQIFGMANGVSMHKLGIIGDNIYTLKLGHGFTQAVMFKKKKKNMFAQWRKHENQFS